MLAEPHHRLFLALHPPPLLAEQIDQSFRWTRRRGKPVPRKQMHVTMASLDDAPAFPSRAAETMIDVCEGLAAPPSRVIFNRLVGNRSVTVLIPSEPIPALNRLHRQLASALAASGLAMRKGWQFKPHLTLARHTNAPAIQDVDPVSWRASEVALVHSLVGRGEHRLLGSWRLRCG